MGLFPCLLKTKWRHSCHSPFQMSSVRVDSQKQSAQNPGMVWELCRNQVLAGEDNISCFWAILDPCSVYKEAAVKDQKINLVA